MNNIHITVDDKVVKMYLADLPNQMTRAISNTIRKVTFLIERYGKLNAPTDTGRLKNTISNNIYPTHATVQTNVFYAVFVHNGTRFITARPFMRDAADQALPQIEGIALQELESTLI